MKILTRAGFILFVLLLCLSSSNLWTSASSFAADKPPVMDEIPLVIKAINQAIEIEEASVLLMLIYDTRIEKVQLSEDRQWASAWLVPVDPQTGHDVQVEPGLAIVRKINGDWVAYLPSMPEWISLLTLAPQNLITDDARNNLLTQAHPLESQESTTYSGFKLPWAAGETMALTQSTHHDLYTPSGNAHYAFDFAKPGYPSGMFNVHAAKSASVKKAVWTFANGSEAEPGNYLLLEDNTTNPTTYHLYLHLAQYSIPLELRTTGAPVQQGQFIGIADDTGVSSGNHLHFMVHENADLWWGRSVDITFSDVAINGGRPRIEIDLPYCYSTDICIQTQYQYISGNLITSDTTPPTGEITTPTHNTTFDSASVHIEGWASDDDSGIDSVQVKAKFNDSWHLIGSSFSTEIFALDWDMCADNVPDGPITLALELQDKAGNPTPDLPGLTQITKNFSCPQPALACIPNDDQVALYAKPDYQGTCSILGVGNYANASELGEVGDDNIASILVGDNVMASLFSQESYQGRSETFLDQDSHLSDNRIGSNMVSSLMVQNQSSFPLTPRPKYPFNNASYPSDASLSLTWENAAGGLQFQARLLENGNEVKNSGWLKQTHWHLSSLPPGNYTWQVKAINNSGESAWSSEQILFIQSDTLAASIVHTLPYFDDIETLPDWSHSNYWDLTNEINHTQDGSISWFYDTNSSGYDTGYPNSGYLTLPLVYLPENEVAFFRFWYYAETEDSGEHWDQRWVQISTDNGPFQNLYQLTHDPTNNWLSSPAISLEAYAGMTVRIRFYFATLDSLLNQFKGWYIDDVSINTNPPPNCLDTDNTPGTASLIEYSNTMIGLICPAGEQDYYAFQALEGDKIGGRITAFTLGSELDSFLTLYDADGVSVLAENDDLVLYEQPDSQLSYDIKRSGTYFLSVRSWDHPSSGGYAYFYELALYMDKEDPSASFIYPKDGEMVTDRELEIAIAASDLQTGVNHVDFWWHSSDWQSAEWRAIGQDFDGTDGWSMAFDTSVIDTKSNFTIYANVFDNAGNSIGIGSYNLFFPHIYLPLILR